MKIDLLDISWGFQLLKWANHLTWGRLVVLTVEQKEQWPFSMIWAAFHYILLYTILNITRWTDILRTQHSIILVPNTTVQTPRNKLLLKDITYSYSVFLWFAIEFWKIRCTVRVLFVATKNMKTYTVLPNFIPNTTVFPLGLFAQITSVAHIL